MKKLLLVLVLSVFTACFLVIGVSAADYTPAFGEITFVDGMAEDSVFGNDGKADSCTSRVLMSDGKTYPTYYILDNSETLAVNFSELNKATGLSYERNTVICLEICEGVTTLPNCFSASGSAIFWGDKYTSTLEYLKTPSTLTSLSSDATIFSMKALKCIDFSLSKFEAIPSRGVQGASALEEIYFPSTLKTLVSDSLNGCSSIKKLDFSNTQLETLGYRALFNCNALEEVNLGSNLKKIETQSFYRVGTTNTKSYVVYKISSTLEEIYNQFGTIWQEAKTPVIYYTGTLDDEGMTILKTNSGISNWQLIDINSADYDENAEYTARTLIYNCNSCITFFGSHAEGKVLNSCQFGCGRGCGQVSLLENPQHESLITVNFSGERYYSSASVSEACAVCTTSISSASVDALFTSLGVSAKEFGADISIVQGYALNRAAIEAYKSYLPDFNFGVLAYANTSGGQVAPKPGDDKVADISFDNMANDYIEVKIVGIPADYADIPIVFCIYVTEGDKICYLDNGSTKDSVLGFSYNSIN